MYRVLADLKLVFKDNVRIGVVVKASLADVKAATNVAITSRPRADGTLEAVELRIFPAGQPFNSFHGDWDLMRNSFMTNGSLQTLVAGVDGQVLTVKYKIQGKPDEEKKIVVTSKTIIATTVPGTKEDLKPGLKVFVAGAPKLPDGSLDVAAIQVEKEIPRRSDMMAIGERAGDPHAFFRYFLIRLIGSTAGIAACCARGQRPSHRGAAEQRDELAPLHLVVPKCIRTTACGSKQSTSGRDGLGSWNGGRERPVYLQQRKWLEAANTAASCQKQLPHEQSTQSAAIDQAVSARWALHA